MNWRRIMRWLVGIVAAVALTGGTFIASGGATARAAPGVAAYRVPHEVSKFTLGETSYDGPALWTQRGPSAPAGPLAVLAWTGTDSRLNFVFTNDGVSYFGKKTLNETSFVRPAVVRGQGVGGSVAPVALAWTGTDAGHRLNVLYDVPGAAPMKLTLWSDNSFTSPAIEWLGGNTSTLLLAWAGTDADHALNILPINVTDQGLVAGTKITQWNFHSFGQPALIHDYTILPKDTRFFLSWSDMASRRIAWATSPDGKMWTQQPTFYETSGSAPSMIGLNETLAHMPPYWLGWTGTDAAHHVNVLYALDINQWTTNFVKATLPETAVGGTVIGFFLAAPPHDDQMLVAWTGTDAAHHLNVAWVGV